MFVCSFLIVQRIYVFRIGSSEKSYLSLQVCAASELSVHFICKVYSALSQGCVCTVLVLIPLLFPAVNMKRMVRLRKRQSIHTVS